MKNKKGSAITILFLTWICGVFVINLLLPDREFSAMENRYLTQLPDFSVKALLNGKFTAGVEDYLNDQIVARDQLVQLNTAAAYLAGQRAKQDVYYAADGSLIQSFAPESTEQAAVNAAAIAAFAADAAVPVYLALIPGRACINAELLPAGAPNTAQKSLIAELYNIAGVNCVDLYSELYRHRDEYIYYHTDHHWTSLGAYYGYAALAPALGLTALPLAAETQLSTQFLGTLYARAPLWWIKPDTISAYVPEEGIRVAVYEGKEKTDKQLYCEEFLQVKDKYKVFLGGNAPQVVVSTQNTSGPRLLLLRDSYADSLAPFLTQNCAEIHLLDPRYYKLSIRDYIEENDIDMVLFCYSVANFAADSNLAYVLQGSK